MEVYGVLKEIVSWASIILGFYIFYKFFKVRDILDQGTVNIFRQVKSWWGTEQIGKRWEKRDKSEAYQSGKAKFMSNIKEMVPWPFSLAIEDFTPDEMEEYLMNQDTLNLIAKAREVLGGAKMPQLPGMPGQSEDDKYRMKTS